jgi:hypothetical protein
MQRLIAGLLLLLAFAGTFLPPALQATVAPSHLCCSRTAQHRCHSFALTEPGQTAIHGTGCPQNCRRAMATSQWAHPETPRVAVFADELGVHETVAQVSFPETEVSSFQSTRAPPTFPFA